MEHGGVIVPLAMFALVGLVGRVIVAMAAPRMWRSEHRSTRVRAR